MVPIRVTICSMRWAASARARTVSSVWPASPVARPATSAARAMWAPISRTESESVPAAAATPRTSCAVSCEAAERAAVRWAASLAAVERSCEESRTRAAVSAACRTR